MLGIGRDGEHEGALFRKADVDRLWRRDAAVRPNTLTSLAVDHTANKLSDAKLNATGRDFCQIWCD